MKHLLSLILLLNSALAMADGAAANGYPVDAIRRLADIFETIRQHHFEEVEDEELINYAIHGMLNGLDPHSTYLPPDDYNDIQEHTKGEFVGLGIEIEMHDDLVRIVSPIDGSPAEKAGLQSGDLIYKLDDDSVRGMNITEAIDKMRGLAGTEITLSILRESSPKPLLITVTRDVVTTASVRSEYLDRHIGYIRIANFEADTGDELVNHLQELTAKPMKGLILDLRSNPGGSLDAAVSVSDAFINDGMIVYTRGRSDEHALDFVATEGDMLGGAPIIVLINDGSASASEIVAGALKDHQRAIIVGTDSFGKGSVQQVLGMSEGYGLKLTTALYFTPNGHSIQATGIHPDIVVKAAKVTPIERAGLSEAALPSHIENSTQTKETEAESDTFETDDNQLQAAYNMMKAMTL